MLLSCPTLITKKLWSLVQEICNTLQKLVAERLALAHVHTKVYSRHLS